MTNMELILSIVCSNFEPKAFCDWMKNTLTIRELESFGAPTGSDEELIEWLKSDSSETKSALKEMFNGEV